MAKMHLQYFVNATDTQGNTSRIRMIRQLRPRNAQLGHLVVYRQNLKIAPNYTVLPDMWPMLKG